MEEQKGNTNQLANIGSLHRIRYFWGTLTRDDAKSVIVNYPPRSYIMTYNPDVEQFELHFKDHTPIHLGLSQFLYDNDPQKLDQYAKTHWTHFLSHPIGADHLGFPSLKELARNSIRSREMINIDGLKDLNYPMTLKEYLVVYTVKPGNQNCCSS